MTTNKITILTTTKNASAKIINLIASLNVQSDKNFSWIVVDSSSTDNTIEIIKNTSNYNYKIVNTNDFSIYHAMNIGITNVITPYYCVAGADDLYDINFIKKINLILENNSYDLIFGGVEMNGFLIKPMQNKGWLYGMHGVGSSHSVGTIIKKNLHYPNNLYSNLYPIVADQYFIKKALNNKAKGLWINDCFGTYATNGFSSSSVLHYQIDFLKMQLETERYSIVQLTLFILRILKNFISNKIKHGI